MSQVRISLTEKNKFIKGVIKLEGNTSFIQSCLAEVINKMAKTYECTPERVLQDIYYVICKEKEENEQQA